MHMDADIYISTRPVLDTLLGPLRYRYLVLFDEFYSVNHEFRAGAEYITRSIEVGASWPRARTARRC